MQIAKHQDDMNAVEKLHSISSLMYYISLRLLKFKSIFVLQAKEIQTSCCCHVMQQVCGVMNFHLGILKVQ
jgi:hypothetical protein